jgi:tetratricopeptide (TPR) repeat protein
MPSTPPPLSTIPGLPHDLLGRGPELFDFDRLLQERARTGFGLTVFGTSGIGKTALLKAILARAKAATDDGPRLLSAGARPGDRAYGLFGRLLRVRFGVVDGLTDDEARAQVRAAVERVYDDRKVGDVLRLFGPILGIEFPTSPLLRALESGPEGLKFLTQSTVRAFFELDATRHAEASGQATILAVDDLHQADGESLELLAYLVAHAEAPLVVVGGARPELLTRFPRWGQLPNDRHRVVELGPLSSADASTLVERLLSPVADRESVDELVEAACTLAGGNPGLLEQMIRVYFDAGVLRRAGGHGYESWVVDVDRLDRVQLPLTVADAVNARISALGASERVLLQHAALMGGVFWLGGLVALQRREATGLGVDATALEWERDRIRAILQDLSDRDYVLRLPDSSFPREDEYVFKHNLEREALAALVPPDAARASHLVIADWLTIQGSTRHSEDHLEALARHLERGGNLGASAEQYLLAGDLARTHFANLKAAECYERALALFGQTASGLANDRLRAYHHHGDVLERLGRNDEALDSFESMLQVAARLGALDKTGAAHARVGRLLRELGRLDEGEERLREALALFEKSRDERGVASTLDDLGKVAWRRGDYASALDVMGRALTMRQRIGDRRSIAVSLNNLGNVHHDTGAFRRAIELFEGALKIRREIGDLVGLSITLNNLGTLAQDQKDDARARDLFEEALAVAKETGNRNRIAMVLTNVGYVHHRLGDDAKAIETLKQAEQLADELGDKLSLAEALRGLGKAHLARGELTKARESIGRSVELFREVGGRVQEGIALRTLGETLAQGSAGGHELEEARAHLRSSIALFEGIGNDIELAKSCRVLADILRSASVLTVDLAAEEEAKTLEARAEAIFVKVRGSTPDFERALGRAAANTDPSFN